MFAKLSVLALVLPAVVSAFELKTPTDWTAGNPGNVSWTFHDNDPPEFNLLLHPAVTLGVRLLVEHKAAIIQVPAESAIGSGYTLVAYDPNDARNVYDTSDVFSIYPPY